MIWTVAGSACVKVCWAWAKVVAKELRAGVVNVLDKVIVWGLDLRFTGCSDEILS